MATHLSVNEDEAAALAAEADHQSRGTWVDYLKPLRFDHWIKNLVVPVGSTLALVAYRVAPDQAIIATGVLAFLISGCVSSVNYVVNEILDARFDARHPQKRTRPIPSGRVRVGPLLGLTLLIAAGTFVAAAWLFPARFLYANLALFVAALLYNLPPVRLKDSPYFDAVVESVTNPIRLSIGWYAMPLPALTLPPISLLALVWAFGAFLMTGKRLAELRMLGPQAAQYRQTFEAYSVRSLFVAQLGYAVLTLLAATWLFASERPHLLATLPLIAGILAWTFKMTFEPDSPLIDPEHLYRRKLFLLLMLAAFAAVAGWALV